MPSEPRYKAGDKIEIAEGVTVGGVIGGYEITLNGAHLDLANAVATKERAEGRAEALGEVDAAAAKLAAVPTGWQIGESDAWWTEFAATSGNVGGHDTFTAALLSTEGESEAAINDNPSISGDGETNG